MSNRIDDLANELQSENRFHEIEAELNNFDPTTLNDQEKEAWYHLQGISASKRGDHDEAFRRFLDGLEQMPDSQYLKFSLGQEYIVAKEPDTAFALFDQCHSPPLPPNYFIAMSRYAYIYGKYQRGIDYMLEIFNAYWGLKELDDHFLYMQGLPFFSEAWGHLAVHCLLNRNKKLLHELTHKTQEMCHDFDFVNLEFEMDAYSTRKYLPLIEKLKTSFSGSEDSIPSGYHKTKLACLQLRYVKSYQEAMTLLDGIQFNNQDFPWLMDVVLVSKARMANIYEETEEEERNLELFFQHQPLLLEPNHALTFDLLAYQEKLKMLIR